jgi:hypothetical protein
MLGAQPANELAEHDAQIAGHECGIGCPRHDSRNYTGNLYR